MFRSIESLVGVGNDNSNGEINVQNMAPTPPMFQPQICAQNSSNPIQNQSPIPAIDWQQITAFSQNLSKEIRRPRTKFTPHQLAELEKSFQNNQYLSKEICKELAKNLQIPENLVKSWFNRKRYRIRKKLKKEVRRRFQNEYIYEIIQFLPLNYLIVFCLTNSVLYTLAKKRAQKVHEKLNSLYFDAISNLASWLGQWAMQMEELRASINPNLSNVFGQLMDFFPLIEDFTDRMTKVIETDRVDNILNRFNFPLAFQNKLCQIRSTRVEQALAPAKFEISQWRWEINSNWQRIAGLFAHYVYDRDITICENLLEQVANHLNPQA